MIEYPKEDERGIWPGRYRARAIAKEAFGYKDVSFILHHANFDDDEAERLLTEIGYSKDCEDYLYLVSQLEETFTKDQIEEIRMYFENSFDDTVVETAPARLPAHHYMGVGALAVGGGTDFHMFTQYKDYPLSFKMFGYYDIRNADLTDERLVTEVKEKVLRNMKGRSDLITKLIAELHDHIDDVWKEPRVTW